MSRSAPVVLFALLLLLRPGLHPSAHAAATPAVLTNIASIQSLSRTEAARQIPVRFQGALTAGDSKSLIFYIQDDTAAIPVQSQGKLTGIAVGQHVEIEGTTQPLTSGPSVKVSRVTPLDRVALPKPRPGTVQDLLDERWEGIRVVVDGIVTLAGRVGTIPGDFVIGLNLQDGTVVVHITSLPQEAWVLKSVGTRLRITGICRPLSSPRGITTAASVLVTQSNQIERVEGKLPALARPKSTPRPIRLLPHYHNDPSAGDEAVIEGIVTGILSQRSFFLQDRSGGVLVRTLKPLGLQPGDRLVLQGLPRREFIPAATNPEEDHQVVFHAQDVESLGPVSLPKAQPVDPSDLLLNRNNHRRVEVDATLLATARPVGSPSLQLTLQAGSSMLEALVRDAPTNATLLPALGSRVRVQGVLDHRGQPDSDQRALRLYLATMGDLALLQAPPRNYAPVLGWTAGGLGALGLLTLAWALTLRRVVRQRTAELTQANAAKRQFLANMSHEIRTPLHAMLGLVQVLDRQHLAPEQGKLVGHVQQAGKSLLRILNDILDFSRVEAGQLTLERRAFALPELLGHLDALFRDSARDRGLTWQVLPPSGDPLEGNLLGDPVRVQQILSNLASNALKFTERGLVEVSTRVVQLTDTAARLRFTVTDTGPGLAPDALGRLFQPFTQGDASIHRRYGGSGLGLSICRRLVDLMGGTMGADSQPGRGSAFWTELTFDRTREPSTLAQPQASASHAHPPRLAGRRILVVDDNRLNLEVAEWVLRQEGATPLLVESAEAALALVSTEQGASIEAILMDLEMPEVDGLTAICRLRADPARRSLPILACTAGPSAERRAAALAAGAQEFLGKPFDIDELVGALVRCLPPAPAPAPAVDGGRPSPVPRPQAPFPAIPGLDTWHAATVLRHDRALFEKLLKDFVVQFGDLPERLTEDLASGRAAQAGRRLHQLRGIAGYLGALELAEDARRLHLAILEGATHMPHQLATFTHRVQVLLAALQATTTTPAPPAPTATPAPAPAALAS